MRSTPGYSASPAAPARAISPASVSSAGQVQFECGVSGFASQTSYNGFYYSSGDVPLGFGGTGDMTLAPSGAGWCWEETEGDNWYYTERLRSGWYYYEMHF